MKTNLSNLFIGTAVSVIACIFPCSCNKDNSVLYTDRTFGFVSDVNQITTDAGLVYNIVPANELADLDFWTRIYAECEVTECTDNIGKSFNAKLVSLNIPLIAPPLKGPVNTKDWPDAINASEAWISGGYLNIYCTWIALRNSETKHETSLVYNGTVKDTVSFSLMHNGNGEGYYENSGNTTDLIVTNKLATFPIQEYLPDGNVTIKLSWKWHRSEGNYILPETDDFNMTYSLSDTGVLSEDPSTKATISPFTTFLP